MIARGTAAQTKTPAIAGGGFAFLPAADCDQPADEDDAGAIGAADEDAGAIVLVVIADDADASADEAADDTEASAEEAADEIAETADETAELAASDEDATALEAVVVVLVELPRLKTQMRPMMIITATMMMIQVLRFIG